ncbi:30338_t:CDS:1 [Gigaspora margarita]|uniref:30338_t:CDS:1 n=1 Tax=Gigaspora margarita TaxID=4874 RepID=A0ABN7W2X5_GIGMA|nr:30338_t:CDS:1 [Gigaspora margarita]
MRKPQTEKGITIHDLNEHIKYLKRLKKRSSENLAVVFDRVIEIFEIHRNNIKDEIANIADYNRERRALDREKAKYLKEIEDLELLNKQLIEENKVHIELERKINALIEEKDLIIIRLRQDKEFLRQEKDVLMHENEVLSNQNNVLNDEKDKFQVLARIYEWSNKKKDDEIEKLRRLTNQ